MNANLNNNPNFEQTDDANDIVILCPQGRTNSTAWRAERVGRAYSPEVLDWDGVDRSFDLAVGSRYDGIVSAVKIEITGRVERRFGCGTWGLAAVVEFADKEAGRVPAIIPSTSPRFAATRA